MFLLASWPHPSSPDASIDLCLNVTLSVMSWEYFLRRGALVTSRTSAWIEGAPAGSWELWVLVLKLPYISFKPVGKGERAIPLRPFHSQQSVMCDFMARRS